MRRTAVQLIVAVLLLALLAVLGTLQYRWLGEVSNAERDRLRNGMRARAADFTRDFDREVTRAYMTFRADPQLFDADAASALSDAWARAQRESSVGGLIRTVYYLEGSGPRALQLQLLDPAARTLTPTDWPPDLAQWQQRAAAFAKLEPLPPVFLGDAVDARIPALLIAVPSIKRFATGDRLAVVHDTDGASRTVIIRLDGDKVRRQLIESLAARYFGPSSDSEFLVSVMTRDDPPQVVFRSSPDADVTPKNADVTTGLFDLRMEDVNRFNLPAPPPGGSAQPPRMQDRVAVTIVRRSAGPDAARVLMAGGDAQGAWQVLVRSRSGSLEALVARSRYRNLAVGLGILGLLAASFIFMIASAQRQQRLARQQMEFVAAVSHELRTPLAVIRSAAENLADGVVGDPAQVKKYGSLIRGEGRRLSDMVERVMEFAGITSGALVRGRADVDLARVVADAVRGVEADAAERGVTVALRTAPGLPPVAGDEIALGSAVQNVIGNAVKYSTPETTVQIDVDLDAGRVRLRVADRGLGIDGADLPHVFKPFYRGRRAVDAQIRGTGVGLSVVRHVVDAHNGDIRIESHAGEGTVVTMRLPAAERREGYVRDASEARAT